MIEGTRPVDLRVYMSCIIAPSGKTNCSLSPNVTLSSKGRRTVKSGSEVESQTLRVWIPSTGTHCPTPITVRQEVVPWLESTWSPCKTPLHESQEETRRSKWKTERFTDYLFDDSGLVRESFWDPEIFLVTPTQPEVYISNCNNRVPFFLLSLLSRQIVLPVLVRTQSRKVSRRNSVQIVVPYVGEVRSQRSSYLPLSLPWMESPKTTPRSFTQSFVNRIVDRVSRDVCHGDRPLVT